MVLSKHFFFVSFRATHVEHETTNVRSARVSLLSFTTSMSLDDCDYKDISEHFGRMYDGNSWKWYCLGRVLTILSLHRIRIAVMEPLCGRRAGMKG